MYWRTKKVSMDDYDESLLAKVEYYIDMRKYSKVDRLADKIMTKTAKKTLIETLNNNGVNNVSSKIDRAVLRESIRYGTERKVILENDTDVCFIHNYPIPVIQQGVTKTTFPLWCLPKSVYLKIDKRMKKEEHEQIEMYPIAPADYDMTANDIYKELSVNFSVPQTRKKAFIKEMILRGRTKVKG